MILRSKKSASGKTQWGIILPQVVSGIFVYVPLATLLEWQTAYNACLLSIASGLQSYSIAGRTFTRANLKEVSATVAEIAYAVKLNSGALVKTTYADLSNG